jgi:hypothetical protein
MLQALCHGLGGGEFVEIAKDFWFAVFDKFIGPGDALDGGVNPGLVQELDHRGSKAVLDHVVLEGADDATFSAVFFNHSGIERLDESHQDYQRPWDQDEE